MAKHLVLVSSVTNFSHFIWKWVGKSIKTKTEFWKDPITFVKLWFWYVGFMHYVTLGQTEGLTIVSM